MCTQPALDADGKPVWMQRLLGMDPSRDGGAAGGSSDEEGQVLHCPRMPQTEIALHIATRSTHIRNIVMRLIIPCVYQTPQAQQTSTFVLPQGGADPLADMMSQLDQRLAGPQRQVPPGHADLTGVRSFTTYIVRPSSRTWCSVRPGSSCRHQQKHTQAAGGSSRTRRNSQLQRSGRHRRVQ
jgi:hypothetical protein